MVGHQHDHHTPPVAKHLQRIEGNLWSKCAIGALPGSNAPSLALPEALVPLVYDYHGWCFFLLFLLCIIYNVFRNLNPWT